MTKPSINPIDYGLIESLGDGGAFYLDGSQTKLSITGQNVLNKLKISNVKSGGNGGLIYSKALLGLTLRDIELSNSETVTDGGVMYLFEN